MTSRIAKLATVALLASAASAFMVVASSPADAFREKVGKNCYRDCQMKCSGPLGMCTSRRKVCGETMCHRASR
jgi:hypothetical protein